MSTYYVNPAYTGTRYAADAYDYGRRQSAQYPASGYVMTPVSGYVPRASLVMAGVGAIVGGSAAAAKNIRRVKNGEATRREAVQDTAKEAAGAAIATGVATGIMGYIGTNNTFLSVLGTIAVATGTKYLWDGALSVAGGCADTAAGGQ